MNVPKLRFKEFDGEWAENSLAKLATFSKGKGISKDNLSTDGKPCILYGELYTKYKEVASTIYSRTNIESSDLIKSEKLDVLIPSSGETAKDIACSTCIIQEDVLIGGDLNILRFGKEIDGRFISYQINGIKKLELSKYAQGATVVHLYSQGIKKLRLNIPTIEEQKKISELLLLLNKKIQLQQQKIDLLQEQKKGYMQKIFNQEIRFKDEKGEYHEWQNKSIDEVAKIIMGQSPDSKAYSEDPANTVLVQGNADLKNGKIVPRIYTSQLTKMCEIGDIILTVRAPVGIVAKCNIPACIGRGVCVIKADDFLFYYLDYYNMTSQWAKLSQGSTFESVNSNDIKNIVVPQPCEEEKMKISKFFKRLMERIQLEEAKLLELKLQKQGFMQQMFI